MNNLSYLKPNKGKLKVEIFLEFLSQKINNPVWVSAVITEMNKFFNYEGKFVVATDITQLLVEVTQLLENNRVEIIHARLNKIQHKFREHMENATQRGNEVCLIFGDESSPELKTFADICYSFTDIVDEVQQGICFLSSVEPQKEYIIHFAGDNGQVS